MRGLFLALCLSLSLPAVAGIDAYEFQTPEQEQQYRRLVEELRCPKCQNQNLAGSDALVAQDLKERTYRLVMEGRGDDEIIAHMVERYGDFITYRPPLRAGTVLLWTGPFLLLLVVAAVLVWRVRRPAATAAPLSEDEQKRLRELLDDPTPKP
jgi:cytochrome c-type biogenesis protein CcmH